ncbi:hypothetical protein RW1_034_00050 [Rhodococcus wratislaviensis NBRC 100605]|uniref:Uncharacterized protein n=1 Tax=Rhodococcus wratislaviensis NBRC 100605 TaxID=1219028 RepID=X0R789_RHOWR|nr:hypothetical protein RW1_034_00050 [Rhodococcus wratislaviensis NBRC 100605]
MDCGRPRTTGGLISQLLRLALVASTAAAALFLTAAPRTRRTDRSYWVHMAEFRHRRSVDVCTGFGDSQVEVVCRLLGGFAVWTLPYGDRRRPPPCRWADSKHPES